MTYTLITGASKRLGRTVALELASRGFDLILHYKNSEKEALELLNACRSFHVKAEIIYGDFSSNEGLESFVHLILKEFSGIRNLINNVGNYLIKGPKETTIQEMQDLIQVNLLAPFRLMQILLPKIAEQKGSIINLGVAGLNEVRAETYSTAYSMTKSNLLMLTKSLAKEYAKFDVSINMVSPGVLEESIDLSYLESQIPMKRVGTYREVADLIFFLLEDKNHYITGQNIEVAGGVRL